MGLEVTDVSKHYGDVPALNRVSLKVEKGEFFTILGPSGCGKTTLLKIIAGLELCDSGRISIGGEIVTKIPANKRNVNTVFQNYALFPHLSVYENIAFGLRSRKFNRDIIEERVGKALEMLQLTHTSERYPAQLSGGQQQRVALARALVNEPAILLLDEPMSALDARLRSQVQVELRNLQRRLGKTFIMVTHDQDEALTVSDRIAVMNLATIVQIGTPTEIYERPKNKFVANFIGDANMFEATRTGDSGLITEYGTLETSLPIPWQEGAVVIRPENIRLHDSNPGFNTLPLKVRDSIYRGDHQEIWFEENNLKAKTTNHTLYRPGTEVWLEFLKDALVPLNEEE